MKPSFISIFLVFVAIMFGCESQVDTYAKEDPTTRSLN